MTNEELEALREKIYEEFANGQDSLPEDYDDAE